MQRLSRTILLGALCASPILAVDDRENTDPTTWDWKHGYTEAQVVSLVNSGYRIVDLEIASISPLRFTAAFVKNSGSYQSGWWWYFGQTALEMVQKAVQHDARVVDLERYESNGKTLYAFLLVPNGGSNKKTWTYTFDQDALGLIQIANQGGYRIIDLESFTKNGQPRFAAIFLKNSGNDYRKWYLRPNVEAGKIISTGNPLQSSPYDIERNDSGKFDVIYVERNGDFKGVWVEGSSSEIDDVTSKWGTRIIDLETHQIANATRFSAIVIDNVAPELRTAINHFVYKTDGEYGLLRQDIGKNAPVELAHRWVNLFEPAQSIGMLPYVHTALQSQNNAVNLGEKITVHTGTVSGCPSNTLPVKITLQAVMEQVAQNGSATALKALVDRFGAPALQATATQLFWSLSQMNHTFGCKGSAVANPNQLSLEDAYDAFNRPETVFLTGEDLALFRSAMQHSVANWPGFAGTKTLAQVITEEAAKLNLPASTVSIFRANTSVHGFVGEYDLFHDGKTHYYRNAIGQLRLPFRNLGKIVHIGTFGGAYVHAGTGESGAEDAVADATCELYREPIRSALQTWVGYQSGSFTSFGSPCLGSSGLPVHGASGLPDIGETLTYSMSNGTANLPAIFQIGFSTTNWNGLPLPFELAPFGAPGCWLRVPGEITLVTGVDLAGHAQVQLPVPMGKGLIGLSYYTQYWSIDAQANQLGLTFSNAIRTQLGGKK